MAVESRQQQRHASPLASARVGALLAGGTTGNELLTTVTGTVLLVLLAVIGVTILRIHALLSVHIFLGMLLIGPLALKLASTGYRFVRYYTGNPRYASKGAPAMPSRLIAPVVVLSTVVVMGSGVALLFAGPGSRTTLLPIHKDSFFVWVAFTGLHVLGHLSGLRHGLSEDYRPQARLGEVTAGRSGRVMSVASALTLGVVIAVLCIPQFGPWLHASFHHHH
jgi:hypothetical protein